MRAILVCALLIACGGSTEEPEPAELRIERMVMPDFSQPPFELVSPSATESCPLDCALDIRLPIAPVTLEVTDAAGNEFHVAVDELSAGAHVVERPLAPESGVFATYRLEYEVR